MKFEDLLLEVGGFGRFQIITLLLMAIFRVTPAFLYLLGNFVAVVPPHRCALQDLFGNLTEERLILINIPRELDGTFSSCKMYREAQWHILKNSTWGPPNASAMQICQNGWDYDHSQFSSTIATEWDLVCEQKWLNKASSTFFFIGVMVGSILIGYLSDRWLPESPRWLLSKGKVKETYALLVRCSSVNGQAHVSPSINMEVLSKVAEEENTGKHYSFIDLFRTPVLRKVSICVTCAWFGASFSYYGISFNITGFKLDIYMTQFLYGAIEIPFKLGLYIFLKKAGRRHALAWSLLITGFCIGINIMIPVSFGVLRTIIAVMGKGFSGASFAAIYLFSAELYPTILRQNGCGFSAFVGRIGSSVAPLILLLDEVWKPLPQVIYCSVAVASGLITYCLHETLNMRLPETVKDIENTRSKSISPTMEPEEVIRMQKF
ncbi:solute carrier family 22 member 7-like isoform X2 [Pleurodeles waltl]|uniref:solute carrier family 22 member 7-like isoform X2 n=1 Tax=Pleurodeles waltl TaxID=8319 RepID=UPI0037097777